MKFAHSVDEAKTKWCPFVRAVVDAGGEHSANRWPDSDDVSPCGNNNRCLASHCMAWRWVETNIDDPEGGPDLVLSDDTHGFCGLAAAPQIHPWRSR